VLLDFCLRHAKKIGNGFDAAAMRSTSGVEEARPFGASDALLVSLRWSTLCAHALVNGRSRAGPRSTPLVVVDDFPDSGAAERSRLVTKGKMLFDHCLSQRSKVCTVGFVEYELSKSPSRLDAMLAFLSALAESRLELSALPGTSADRFPLPWVDVMIDEAWAIVHGYSSEAAERLCAARQPDD
jgi:hypothetical protein